MPALLVGVDVVDVREVAEALSRFGERYLSRVYTPAEVAYALSAPGDTARRLAARFAAKEATIKALQASEQGVDPRCIDVTKLPNGACGLTLSGSALVAARRVGAISFSLSMTHQGSLAAAVVVAERRQTRISLLRKRTGARSCARGAHRP